MVFITITLRDIRTEIKYDMLTSTVTNAIKVMLNGPGPQIRVKKKLLLTLSLCEGSPHQPEN